jgi:quercetin dioxygenase-like cupin family protein
MVMPERAPAPEGDVSAADLLQQALTDAPGTEVRMQLYTVPPGTAVPWHIHPDAHEFDYLLSGGVTLEVAGEPQRAVKAGDVVYVAPNVVHRSVNESATEPMRVLVLRIKPKDAPITVEVPAPR